jgi:MFS family permease
MMNDLAFGEEVAGIMAAWNYAGYLAGVLLMRGAIGQRRYILLIAYLLASIITTACMGLAVSPIVLYGIRFIAGIASGACFVLCSSIVLDVLAALDRPVLSGIFYSGVGAGIAIGGLFTGPLVAVGGSQMAWFGLAVIAAPLAMISIPFLRSGLIVRPFAQVSPLVPREERRGGGIKYWLLLISYFLEGFGYIIGATFIVTLVQNTTNSPGIAQASWIVTGCAAALSTPLWRLAARKSYLPMLILVFLLQGAGTLLPAISVSPLASLCGGILLGGTFMGITVLSLQYGVLLSGKPSAHTIAIMTALYGAGQILGPIVAGGQGIETAFIVSAASLFIGAIMLTVALFVKNEQ